MFYSIDVKDAVLPKTLGNPNLELFKELPRITKWRSSSHDIFVNVVPYTYVIVPTSEGSLTRQGYTLCYNCEGWIEDKAIRLLENHLNWGYGHSYHCPRCGIQIGWESIAQSERRNSPL